MKFKPYILEWDPSTTADVTYRIRLVKEGDEINYDLPYVGTGALSVKIPDDFAGAAWGWLNFKGNMVIAATAINAQGTESDFATLIHPVDLTIPVPPINLRIS